MKVKTINISLPADLLRFIREKVRGGSYSSASEVIRDGLRLLRRSETATRLDEDDFDRARVRSALEGLRRLSETQVLGKDVKIRNLIDEGRR